MQSLFAYGSLKTDGEFFKQIAEHVKHIKREVYVFGKLDFLHDQYVENGEYPVLILNEDNKMEKVLGELFEITEEGVAVCDRIEGYSSESPPDSLYLRTTAVVYDNRCSSVAWAYVGNNLYPKNYWWDNNLKRIESSGSSQSCFLEVELNRGR